MQRGIQNSIPQSKDFEATTLAGKDFARPFCGHHTWMAGIIDLAMYITSIPGNILYKLIP
jgi:hypothetical protein